MSSDFKDLLAVFAKYGVRYLVVGGHAVMRYTEPRLTKDLDVWIDTSSENPQRVFQALAEFGAPLDGLTSEDFSQPDHWFQIGMAPVRIDILMSVPGIDFTAAWQNRSAGTLMGVETQFLSLPDLIRAKEAAGRPADRRDLRRLRKAAG